MRYGGLQKFSLTEYDGKLSAIVFTQGCNFRCPYCHNPELVVPELYATPLNEEIILSFIRSRRGELDAVCITGGEPTLQSDLQGFAAGVKEMGFAVKLETNGSLPWVVRGLIDSGAIDFVALDVKAPLSSYASAVRAHVSPEAVAESIDLLLSRGFPHEIRLTYHQAALSFQDIRSIGELVRGCSRLMIQGMRQGRNLDPAISLLGPVSAEEMKSACCVLRGMGIDAIVR
jgi:pyruvate formate lyase activating enzyme